MRLLHFTKKDSANTRGQAMVETAFALLLAIPVILWAFEMSMYCYAVSQYQYAARAGVQYAVTHGVDAPNCSGPSTNSGTSCPDPQGAFVAQLAANVSNASLHPMTTGQVVTSWPDGNNNPGSHVQVVITVPYNPWVKLPLLPPAIVGTATGEVTY